MTFEEFDKWQDKLWQECVKMRDTKGKEYSHDTDRFANFNRLAGQLDVDNITVGWIYLYKHIDGIQSYITKKKTFSAETIRGRIVDAIVYLTLIGGMIQEREWGKAEEGPVGDYLATHIQREMQYKIGEYVQDGGGFRGIVEKINHDDISVHVRWKDGTSSDMLIGELTKC